MPHVAFDEDQPSLKQVLLDDDAVGPMAFGRPLVVGGADELAVDDRTGQRLPNVAWLAEDEHRRPRRRQPVTALDNQSPVVQELHIAEVLPLAGVAVGEEGPVPAHRTGMEEPVRLQLLQDPAVVPARGTILRVHPVVTRTGSRTRTTPPSISRNQSVALAPRESVRRTGLFRAKYTGCCARRRSPRCRRTDSSGPDCPEWD